MIQHLFFDCQFTRMVWATVYAAWGIPKPHSIPSMFGNWTVGIPKEYKKLVLCRCGSLVLVCLALQKLCDFLQQTTIFFASYLLDYALATHVGYPSAASFSGYTCGGVSFFGPGAQENFCPGHGWRSSLRIDSH